MTLIKLTNCDDTTVFVNIKHIVGFQIAMGATEVTLTTENILRVKQTPQDIVLEMDRMSLRKYGVKQ